MNARPHWLRVSAWLRRAQPRYVFDMSRVVVEAAPPAAAYTLNVTVQDWQFIHVGSIPADLAKWSPLPVFVAKVTPLDFDDPKPTNNVWQGRPSP